MLPNKVRPPEVVSNQGAEEKTPADGLSDVILTGDAGLELAIEAAASDWWFTGAMVALKQLVLSGRGFTVDHLSAMVGEPPDPHYWGALLAAAQKLGIIEAVGARVGRDGRLVRVWWGLPT
jgi:hypothetical protein